MSRKVDGEADRPLSLLGARGRAIRPSAIEEAAGPIARAGEDVISLADGTPPAQELPSGEIATALMAAIREPDALGYGAPRGEPELLQAIDEFLDTLGAPPRHTIVTS